MVFKQWEELTEEDLADEIVKAKEAGKQANVTEPRAKTAYYDQTQNLVIIELKNQCLFCFPPSLIQGLENASPEQLADVWITSSGDSMHWDDPNVSLSVPDLLLGCFGTKVWMSRLGSKGGKITSVAKAAAARENGKKGGRPKRNYNN